MDLVDSDRQQGLVVPVWSFYSALLKQVGSDVGCCDLPCLGQDYVSSLTMISHSERYLSFFFLILLFINCEVYCVKQYNNSGGHMLLPHSPELVCVEFHMFSLWMCGVSPGTLLPTL